jgi:type II secretory pathway component PulK
MGPSNLYLLLASWQYHQTVSKKLRPVSCHLPDKALISVSRNKLVLTNVVILCITKLSSPNPRG